MVLSMRRAALRLVRVTTEYAAGAVRPKGAAIGPDARPVASRLSWRPTCLGRPSCISTGQLAGGLPESSDDTATGATALVALTLWPQRFLTVPAETASMSPAQDYSRHSYVHYQAPAMESAPGTPQVGLRRTCGTGQRCWQLRNLPQWPRLT
jgi:hypothetical protein